MHIIGSSFATPQAIHGDILVHDADRDDRWIRNGSACERLAHSTGMEGKDVGNRS
jgi:hypothetical protein